MESIQKGSFACKNCRKLSVLQTSPRPFNCPEWIPGRPLSLNPGLDMFGSHQELWNNPSGISKQSPQFEFLRSKTHKVVQVHQLSLKSRSGIDSLAANGLQHSSCGQNISKSENQSFSGGFIPQKDMQKQQRAKHALQREEDVRSQQVTEPQCLINRK